MIKKLSRVALALLLIFSMLPMSTFANESVSTTAQTDDLTNHYYENDMRALIKEGLIVGKEPGVYAPNDSLTRAEFTAIIVRMLDLNPKSSTHTFSDLKKGAWYEEAIINAYSNGLISGYPDGKFQPNTPINREELAALVSRALDYLSIQSIKEPLVFNDKNKISGYFVPQIEGLAFLGILAHKKGIDFRPKDNINRGEAAAILNRTLKVIENPKVVTSSTTYNHAFEKIVDIQMTKTPKVDGAGQFIASRSNVSYYANPNNFEKGSNEYLQFLDLSRTTGINVKEINASILNNKGKLTNQGQAFVDAGTKLKLNEIYLMAHALHETGNGTSTLSKGIPVDKNGKVLRDKKGNLVSHDKADYVVYNFFGYGARDTDPIGGGSKYGFDRGWFSPEAAILGGASEIATKYIHNDTYQQNTLYKMRWNPANPGKHQYATHTMWAVLQTSKMSRYYDLIDQYILSYEVPKYLNQPGKTVNPTGSAMYHIDTTFPVNKGIVDVANTLNLREGPTTFFTVKAQLLNGLSVKINGENGGWLNVTANGKTGWVAGQYIEYDVDNDSMAGALGEVTSTDLNVRQGPATSFTSLGKIKQNSKVIIEGTVGNWYKVLTEIGGKSVTGWVHKGYIDVLLTIQSENTQENLSSVEPAPIKLGVLTSSTLLQDEYSDMMIDLPADTSVTVLEANDTETLISYQDYIGWVDNDVITVYHGG